MITVRWNVLIGILRINLWLSVPLLDLVSACMTYIRSFIDAGGRLMVLGVVRENCLLLVSLDF